MAEGESSSKEHGRSAADAPQGGPAGAQELAAGYELSDVRIKPIVISVILLAVSIAIIQVVVVWVNDATDHYVVKEEEQEVGQDLRPHLPPPEPRLQPSPDHPTLDREDLATMLTEQRASLIERGWQPRNDSPAAPLVLPADLVKKVGDWISAPTTQQAAPSPETQPADSGRSGGGEK